MYVSRFRAKLKLTCRLPLSTCHTLHATHCLVNRAQLPSSNLHTLSTHKTRRELIALIGRGRNNICLWPYYLLNYLLPQQLSHLPLFCSISSRTSLPFSMWGECVRKLLGEAVANHSTASAGEFISFARVNPLQKQLNWTKDSTVFAILMFFFFFVFFCCCCCCFFYYL